METTLPVRRVGEGKGRCNWCSDIVNMATHDVIKELEVGLGCVGKDHIEPGNLALVQTQPQMVVTLGTTLPPGGIQFLDL